MPKCLSVVCSLDDPSAGVSHDGRNIPSQGSCVDPRPASYEADGSMSATSSRCLSSGEFVSDAQTASPSCPQMLGSDTLIPSGVGLDSRSCGGASIGDTCRVFCAEGYQAVSNETSSLTCAYDRCDNHPCLSFDIDFSECSSLTHNETCVVRYLVGDTGVGDKSTTELIGDSDGHLQGSLTCAEESLELSTVRVLVERVVPRDDHFVQTNGDVSGTQGQTTAACSRWQKGRVERPSRKWRVSVVRYEVANVGLRRTDGTWGGRAPSERDGRKRRAGKTFHHSGISAKGLRKTCRLGSDQKNRYLGCAVLMRPHIRSCWFDGKA